MVLQAPCRDNLYTNTRKFVRDKLMTQCYDFGHSLFFTYLSLTSLPLIRAGSSFFHMISSLRHYDVILILDPLTPSSSCTRMTSSYVMRRQPASLVCP